MDKLLLASKSPRRKEILQRLGINFEILNFDCDETLPENIDAEKSSQFIAQKKIETALHILEKKENFILSADTTIVFENKILGKPQNIEEAKFFLSQFQGKIQKVITGIAIYNPKTKEIISDSEITEVEFSKMTNEEIELCLSKNEWQDAAGGYKIQGFSECFIKQIKGSYSNVVGLSISKVYDMLKKQGFKF